MLECVSAGFEWNVVYNWNVEEFGDVYRAVKRTEARDTLHQFGCLQLAFGGDKKTIKNFVTSVSAWLPSEEREGGAKGADDFVALVRKGLKLKKG